MRICMFILLAFSLHISLQSYSQTATYNGKNVSLERIFASLKDQTGYSVFYNKELLANVSPVTVSVSNMPVKEFMETVLASQPILFRIDGNTIFLSPKTAKSSTTAPETKFTPAALPITGKLTDPEGQPITGASIIIKGKKTGTATDAEGKFSIMVSEGEILVISFVGFTTMEIRVGKETNLSLTLQRPDAEMEQLVVTGYSQASKRMMTGSVGVLNAEAFANKPFSNVDALLQGQLAGIVVSATSGQPGTSQKIRIRGTNTITGDAEPLWVIDGVPMQDQLPGIPSSAEIKAGSLDNIFLTGIAGINPNDIESVTVLKDASAAAIYGSRAAGGVIVVTTKRGKSGAMKVNYSSNYSSIIAPQRDAGLMNAAEKIALEQSLWKEFSEENYLLSLNDPLTRYPVVGVTGAIRSGKGKYSGMTIDQQDAELARLSALNENGYDLLFRNSFSTNQYLSVSGGSSKYAYYTSLGYSNNAGLLKKNNFDRYNIKTNLDIKPSESVKIRLGLDYSSLDSRAPSLSNIDPFRYAHFANPYESAYHADGSYRADETYFSLNELNDPTAVRRPVVPDVGFNIMRELNETSNRSKKNQTALLANVDIKLSRTISFESLASYKFANTTVEEILGIDTKSAFDNRLSVDMNSNRKYSSISQSNININEYILRGQFSYRNYFGSQHTLAMYAGSEMRGSKTVGMFNKRYGYDPVTGQTNTPLPPPSTNGLISEDVLRQYLAALDRSAGDIFSEDRYVSFYGAVEYGLLDKYIFNASVRTDGSSYFGNDRQFNPIWSAGFGWHIMEEGFMHSLRRVMNRLTLRVATGYTGNISKTVTPQLILDYDDAVRNINGNTYRIGYIAAAPNPLLRWEKTQDVKAALDFGFFKDRLSGIFEAYYRKSTDLVTRTQTLSTTGFIEQRYNTASVENKGLELTLNAKPIATKNFGLNLSVNIAYNINKVIYFDAPYSSMSLANIWQGYPLDPVFSGISQGIDPETGLYLYQLRPDAVIHQALDLNKSDNYRYYLGTRTAPYTGGFNIGANYKSFTINVTGVYMLEAYDFDYITPPVSYIGSRRGTINESPQVFQNDLYAQHVNTKKEVANRWTATNTNGSTYPRIWDAFGPRYDFGYYNPMDPEITRGAFLQKLSFLRVRNIVLGYALPPSTLKKGPISTLGFNLSLNNFFTFTSYKGMDPETPGAAYPITRSLTLSVNAGF